MTFLTTKKETVKPAASATPTANQPAATKPTEENDDLPF
jgi:hypothetical protein